jgi:hypothetical protein
MNVMILCVSFVYWSQPVFLAPSTQIGCSDNSIPDSGVIVVVSLVVVLAIVLYSLLEQRHQSLVWW